MQNKGSTNIFSLIGDYQGDFYIYHYGEDLFLTDGTTSPSRYAFERYHGSTMDYEAWRALMTKPHKSQWMQLSYVKNGGTKRTFAYLQSLPLSPPYSATLVFMIDPDRIRKGMPSVTDESGVIFEVIEDNGELLFSTGDWEMREAAEGVALYGGRRMALSVVHSETLPLTYRTWQPIDVTNHTATRATLLVSFSLVVSILLGLLIARRMARRNYQPVRQLLDVAEETGLAEGDARDEFEYLRSAVERSKHLRTLLDSQHAAMREHALQQALINERGAPLSLLRSNGIQFSAEGFAVAMLYLEESSSFLEDPEDVGDELALIRAMVADALRARLAADVQVKTCEVGGMIVLAFNAPQLAQRRAALLDDISATRLLLERESGIVLTVAVSDVTATLRGGYLQAGQAMEYRMVEGRGALLDYAALSERRSDLLREGPPLEARYLAELALDGNLESAQRVMEDYFKHLTANDHLSIDYLRYRLYDLALALLHAQQSLESSEKGGWPDPMAVIQRRRTLGEMRVELGEILKGICRAAAQKDGPPPPELHRHVTEYVAAAYEDPNLSVSGIAERFGVSLGHLSRHFKEREGMGPLEYVQRYRVDRAKEILRRDPSATLDTVARRCGLINANALIRLFKRYEGVTPGRMRKGD